MTEVPLSSGYTATIDDSDVAFIMRFAPWQFHKSSTGRTGYAATYIPIAVPGKTRKRQFRIFMHDLIVLPREGFEVDHRNGNGVDNQRSNLRAATRQQQCFNRSAVNPVSGFKGVSRKTYRFSGDRWHATIQIHGRQIHIGTFAVKEHAALAYNSYAHEHFGEFARLNVLRAEYPSFVPISEIFGLLSDARSALNRTRNQDGTFSGIRAQA